LTDIQERRIMIIETIIGLREKVSGDVSKVRLNSAMATRSERASWRRAKKVDFSKI